MPSPVIAFRFRLIEIDGEDLRREPLLTRKSTLQQSAAGSRDRLPRGHCRSRRQARAQVRAGAGGVPHGFLHRLFVSGSDRAADRWREDYAIAGAEGLDLHHLYRAMAWLGDELPEQQQDGRTPFSPLCTKDGVEERLFAHRRALLTRLDLVFMDTTSLYFEGAGAQTLGHGYSKDHRPDLRQMILAADRR